jgi:S-methylmethionine-dependent homocysteine/selenocysteine methylase
LWNPFAVILDSDAIRQVHRAFLSRGCDVITTATYPCSPRVVQKIVWLAEMCRESRDSYFRQIDCNSDTEQAGKSHVMLDRVSVFVREHAASQGIEMQQINTNDDLVWDLTFTCVRAGLAAASQAAQEFSGVRVALSCPPFADSFEPHSMEGETRFYQGLALIGAQACADIFLIETMANAQTAFRALQAISFSALRKQETWLSFVPRLGANDAEVHILSGEPLVTALRDLDVLIKRNNIASPDVFLANCGSIEASVAAARVFACTGVPFGFYSNNRATDRHHLPYRWEDIVNGWFAKDQEDDEEEEEEEGCDAEEGGDDVEECQTEDFRDEGLARDYRDASLVHCEAVRELRKLGGKVIGGCCGVDDALLWQLHKAYNTPIASEQRLRPI